MRKAFKTIGMLLLTAPITWGASAYAAPTSSSSSFEAPDEVCTGQVVDETGEPVIGAAVKAQGALGGVVTDIDGNFRIPNVKPGTAIEVNYIGYKDASVVWNGSPITINLEPSNNVLDEVVVTALGMKRETKSLGYAMTELKGEDLNQNLINPVQALQGKVAGVEINSSDGGMFGASKILIRGASTLNKNNQPIYVVDGVILDNGIVENDADWASGAQNYGNELKNLNPDDFESVSVLKGAAATALYGSRGLNGAVVITTKSGKGSKGLGIQFSQTFGFDRVTKQPKLQNEFSEGSWVGSGDYPFDVRDLYWTNDEGYLSYKTLSNYGDTGTGWGPSFEYIRNNAKDGVIELYDGELYEPKAYKNNFKDMYKTGFSTNTNLAISGGNENTTFYTSLSYRYNDGTLPNNSFQRFSMLTKGSHKITKDWEVDASFTFTNSKPRNAQPNLGENYVNGTWDRMYDSGYYRDKYKGDHGGLANTSYGDKWGYVPGRGTWWSIWENEYYQKETVFRPTLKLTGQILPWLKWITEGSYNYYFVQSESKQPGSGYFNQGGYYSTSQSRKEQTNLNTNLMFDYSFNEDFRLSGFLRYEYFHNYYASMSANTNGEFIVPNQFFLANGSNGYSASAKISGTKTIHSVAFQAGMSWRDQIFLDVTGRNDWSSALLYADGHGNFSYFYPSVNGSWLVTNSLRNALPELISFWKIRGSWAQVGNDCDAYYINSAYGLQSYTNGFGNGFSTTLSNTTYSQNLKPERKTSWEIGTDFRILHNRIGIDFTFYKENTKDQIMSVSIPSASGYSSALINAGNIQNSGIELALNTTPIQTKDWTWDLNLTWTKNNSKIVSLSELCTNYITMQGSPDYGNYRIGSVAKVGGTYGMLMSDAAPMLDKNVENEDGTIKSYGSNLPVLRYRDAYRSFERRRSGKVEEVGNSTPKFLGGVNTSLRWKNFTLSASFDMRFGGKVASYNSLYGTAYGHTEKSLQYRDEAHGGTTWTSAWDGRTYYDGVLPEGIVMSGTAIPQPDGTTYTVGTGQYEHGETFAELYAAGKVEPVHAAAWHFLNNQWGTFTLNDNWFKTLNYISFRDLSLGYTFDQKLCNKIGFKGLTLVAAAHNLGYLLNTMPNGENPEAVAGTTAAEFRIRQFSGLTTSFTFTINAKF